MRRRFFLFAAPAIVAAPSLMRVSTLPAALAEWDGPAFQIYSGYGELVTDALRNRSEELMASLTETNALYRQICGIPDLIRGTNRLTF